MDTPNFFPYALMYGVMVVGVILTVVFVIFGIKDVLLMKEQQIKTSCGNTPTTILTHFATYTIFVTMLLIPAISVYSNNHPYVVAISKSQHAALCYIVLIVCSCTVLVLITMGIESIIRACVRYCNPDVRFGAFILLKESPNASDYRTA